MNRNEKGPLEGWLLYITNHFTHPLVEAQGASPRHHLARKLSEKGQKMIVFCPLGRHLGSPVRDFVSNIIPRRTVQGNTVYLFPPVIVSPASATTVMTLVMATLFILTYLTLTRIRIVAQYSTTMLVGSVGAVIRMLMRIPLVTNYGDPDFARELGLARKAFGFCEDLVLTRQNAHSVVYVDEVVGSYVRNNFPVRNTLFLPNGGYEFGFVPPRYDSDGVLKRKKSLGLEGMLCVLYAGQITSVYRLDLLVSSAPRIISRLPTVRFLIVGDGPTLADLRKSVREARLDNYFIFTGSIPYDDLSPYIVLSDICVQLLNDWCMGTKVVMYMVHRKPVLASGNWYDRYRLFLRNNENAFLIPSNPEILADKIVEILERPELLERVGESAWRTVMPYTWDRHVEETLRLLRDAANSH